MEHKISKLEKVRFFMQDKENIWQGDLQSFILEVSNENDYQERNKSYNKLSFSNDFSELFDSNCFSGRSCNFLDSIIDKIEVSNSKEIVCLNVNESYKILYDQLVILNLLEKLLFSNNVFGVPLMKNTLVPKFISLNIATCYKSYIILFLPERKKRISLVLIPSIKLLLKKL